MTTTLGRIILVAFALAFFGCRPTEEQVLPTNKEKYGTAQCDFSNGKWYGVTTALDLDSTDTFPAIIQVFKSTVNDFIWFSGFNIKLKKYQVVEESGHIPGIQVVSTMFHGNGGEFQQNFKPIILESFENYFEITRIDEASKEIEGRFQAAYVSVSPIDFDSTLIVPDTIFVQPDSFQLVYPDFSPDTIYLRNGSFIAPLIV